MSFHNPNSKVKTLLLMELAAADAPPPLPSYQSKKARWLFWQ